MGPILLIRCAFLDLHRAAEQAVLLLILLQTDGRLDAANNSFLQAWPICATTDCCHHIALALHKGGTSLQETQCQFEDISRIIQ